MSATAKASASAARYVGDDYEVAVALQYALLALRPEFDIAAIELQSAGAPMGLDDIVVRRRIAPHDFIQTKATTSARVGLDTDYLCQLSAAGGPSLLQKLFRGWRALTEAGTPARVTLMTTRSIDPRDPLLVLRDHHSSLATPLLREPPGGPARVTQARWQEHLGVDEDEFFRFLAAVRFNTDDTLERAREQLSWMLGLSGFRDDEATIGAVLQLGRHWIEDGRRTLTATEIRADLTALGIGVSRPGAIIHIDAVDRTSDEPSLATAHLNWIDHYEGATPGERLRVRNTEDLRAMEFDLTEAQRKVRRLKYQRVLVDGAMHLAHWFAAGATFRDVADFQVEMSRSGLRWASGQPHESVSLAPRRSVAIGAGLELAIAVEIIASIEPEVEAFVRAAALPVRSVVTIGKAVLQQRVATTTEGDSLARAIRDAIRAECSAQPTLRVHLFIGAPGGFALLLGHYWDRLPVQTYEWLGPGAGYAPSLFIAG